MLRSNSYPGGQDVGGELTHLPASKTWPAGHVVGGLAGSQIPFLIV